MKGLPNQAPLKRNAGPGRGHIVLGILVGILIGGGVAAGTAFYLTRSSPFQGKETTEPVAAGALAGGGAPAAAALPGAESGGPLPLPGKPGDPPVVRPQFDFYHLLPQGEKPPSPDIPTLPPPVASPASAQGTPALPPGSAPATAAPSSIVPPLPLPVPAPLPPPAAAPSLPSPTQAVTIPVRPAPPMPAPAPVVAAVSPPPAAAPPASGAGERYFLQAGAFNTASDAENLKARLALMGIHATTQRADVPDRGVVHRVRVGPFPRMDELTSTRNRLVDAGINPTVIRVRAREP